MEYFGHGCGRLFLHQTLKAQIRNLKNIIPAKVREKPSAQFHTKRKKGVEGGGGFLYMCTFAIEKCNHARSA